ncbi:YdaS antitoxin of YdaST toxin-antitoxin system [Modicisalibacter xianhensis]|uniref:YdaS antitoxin of YdaST toxin-antitoxin system n=1 Tax=Modicisalibacter xianhensis TaxID=442341 RepID=A0A4R8G690_9GAMM|nr:YdaS family helix-turn-helix protein [Halomonas xianhensis]TDX30789.1 YdaS antitoxin of YdaST toxin-antitoxin system [Halomonas xianhensis]
MPETQKQSLKQLWKSMSPEQREAVAAKAETTPAYLRQVLACGRRPGAALAKNIELATGGEISRQLLRPDLYADLVHVA